MSVSGVKAVLFDVFGTVVDWHGTMHREIDIFRGQKNATFDTGTFVTAWRTAYRQGLADIRAGKAPKISNRLVYRAGLEKLLAEHKVKNVSEAELEHLSRIDQRFQPWSDLIAGITRLKKKFITGTLSNGTLVALTNMAKNAGLPWDVIISADLLGAHKPAPEAYLKTATLLDLNPEEILLGAAHNYDLKAAQSNGYKTGFICRPLEHGPNGKNETEAEGGWDIISDSIEELAEKLGA